MFPAAETDRWSVRMFVSVLSIQLIMCCRSFSQNFSWYWHVSIISYISSNWAVTESVSCLLNLNIRVFFLPFSFLQQESLRAVTEENTHFLEIFKSAFFFFLECKERAWGGSDVERPVCLACFFSFLFVLQPVKQLNLCLCFRFYRERLRSLAINHLKHNIHCLKRKQKCNQFENV